jgi:GTP-binding protein
MKIKSAVFSVSAPDLQACPAPTLPEFAFIGRSNVGKSSLLNLLTEKRDLAKVSDTPGKTRLINFFLVNGTMNFVDLPGYGFAKGAREERADFNVAVADYLERRPNLVRTFVLIDSRLSPQQIDLDFIAWLAGCAVPYVLVFTKTDKQPSHVQANISEFQKRLQGEGIAVPAIFTSSATTRKGRMELWAYIEQALAEPPRKTAPASGHGSADTLPGKDDGGPEVW